MKEYRVTISTLHEEYVYTVEADNKYCAIAMASESAREDGWNGGGLPHVRAEKLS